MKLKIYNTKNAARTNPQQVPTINMHSKGNVSLNNQAAEILDLNEGDLISFAQDEDRPSDWFILKTNDPSGFILKQRKQQDNRTHSFSSRPLVTEIISSLGYADKLSVNCRISSESSDLGDGLSGYAIITKSAKVKD